jgi:methylaspartate ammonia-lyase
MVDIIDVVTAEGMGGFFYDDQAAIRSGAECDGFLYRGSAATVSFDAIRMPARSLGVGLVLSNGTVAWGDMMTVQYAGAAGRDQVFQPSVARAVVEDLLRPRLLGLQLKSFRLACATVLAPMRSTALPNAVLYGTSQALLRAVAQASGTTMAEVLCAEFHLPVIAKQAPIYAQSGDAREMNVDKMILKRVDVLPHGLINSLHKFGTDGATFLDFVRWVAQRVENLAPDDYRPTLHFDVYGWIGLANNLDVDRIANFIVRARECALPFQLNIEHPADFGSRECQIQGFRALRDNLRRQGCDARIVADEWCNTLDDTRAFVAAGACDLIQIKMPDVGSLVDAVLSAIACRDHRVGVFIGGSCTETDLSAQVSAHVAVATQAAMVLAKPGMGVDEGLSIVGNEQSRLLALLRRSEGLHKTSPPSEPTHGRP